MGGSHSRSHQLVLKSASGDTEGVRVLLEQYILQQQQIRQQQAQQIQLKQQQQQQEQKQQVHSRHASLTHQHSSHSASSHSLAASSTSSIVDPIDIDYSLPEGDFALELAVTHTHIDIVHLLIEHGCNVNKQDTNGLTALMCACHDASPQITQVLLRYGHASLTLQDASGQTALHFACRLGHIKQVAVLLEAYREQQQENMTTASTSALTIDPQTHRGETPLFLAATNGWQSIGRLLLHSGADPHILTRSTVISASAAASSSSAQAQQSAWQYLSPPNQLFHTVLQKQRRCDILISVTYEFLTSNLIELVGEYDKECWLEEEERGVLDGNTAPASSSNGTSSSIKKPASSPSTCIILSRLIAFMKRTSDEQDRADRLRKELKAKKSLLSRSLPSDASQLSASGEEDGEEDEDGERIRDPSRNSIAPPSHILATSSLLHSASPDLMMRPTPTPTPQLHTPYELMVSPQPPLIGQTVVSAASHSQQQQQQEGHVSIQLTPMIAASSSAATVVPSSAATVSTSFLDPTMHYTYHRPSTSHTHIHSSREASTTREGSLTHPQKEDGEEMMEETLLPTVSQPTTHDASSSTAASATTLRDAIKRQQQQKDSRHDRRSSRGEQGEEQDNEHEHAALL